MSLKKPVPGGKNTFSNYAPDGFTPLLLAVKKGHTEVCAVLLEEREPWTLYTALDVKNALKLATDEGHDSTVALLVCELLLLKGKSVDKKNKSGFTPLLAAAQNGYIEVCKLLLKTGKVNLKETTPDGFTPLLLAVQNGHTDVCELLLANGSDLEDSHLDTLDTALQSVALDGNDSLLQLLLSYKANVNSRDKNGFTPLHVASQEGHLASVHSWKKVFLTLGTCF